MLIKPRNMRNTVRIGVVSDYKTRPQSIHGPTIQGLNTDTMNKVEEERISSGIEIFIHRTTDKEYRSRRACVEKQH